MRVPWGGYSPGESVRPVKNILFLTLQRLCHKIGTSLIPCSSLLLLTFPTSSSRKFQYTRTGNYIPEIQCPNFKKCSEHVRRLPSSTNYGTTYHATPTHPPKTPVISYVLGPPSLMNIFFIWTIIMNFEILRSHESKCQGYKLLRHEAWETGVELHGVIYRRYRSWFRLIVLGWRSGLTPECFCFSASSVKAKWLIEGSCFFLVPSQEWNAADVCSDWLLSVTTETDFCQSLQRKSPANMASCFYTK